MVQSKAYEQFKESLDMARVLMQIERQNYQNPPRLDEQKAVKGLRSSIAILIVAAFESYLREVIEEQLSYLSLQRHTPSFAIDKLPNKMRVSHVYKSLDRAMRGPPYQDPPPKVDRLPDIDKACKMIIYGDIDPKVFSDLGGNPNPKNVKAMFSSIALTDIMTRIKPRFDRNWGRPTSQAFIEDKLLEIVNRRHVVAHTTDALKISRRDLKESIKFLRILVLLLDAELAKHVKELTKMCTCS